MEIISVFIFVEKLSAIPSDIYTLLPSKSIISKSSEPLLYSSFAPSSPITKSAVDNASAVVPSEHTIVTDVRSLSDG